MRDDVVDYDQFFSWVAEMPDRRSRIQVRSDLVFVISEVKRQGEKYAFSIVSGDPEEIPLYFNEESGQVEEGVRERSTWPARQTQVVVDPESRLVAIEMRRAGVGSSNLERYFRLLAMERGFSRNLIFDLTMQPSTSFEEELDRYERIREATVVISRPNFDWEDAEDAVTGLADVSGGHTASVTVNAARGESLSRTDGLLAVIRAHVRRSFTSITNARVIGQKRGDNQETSLSLARHQLKRLIEVPTREETPDVRDFVSAEAASFIDETAEKLLSSGDDYELASRSE
ncbi:hypothetical protein ACSBOX_04480 [Arthrobacter sp. KN11-1C]|uniref:hypothetical protein n=1 Tax=Arthrobacter sp. KN11-1C TaxID=3445774 RepID=UPI003FA0F066